MRSIWVKRGRISVIWLMLATFLFLGPAASSRTTLQFVPMIAVAPDEPAQFEDETPACTSPDPVHTFAFSHCYTPAQVWDAYGVKRLHDEGTNGAGETIVIVDAYGSPTALDDLKFFSSTFGLPDPDLTIIHPTGTPTFSSAMHGVQAGWAFETSLDLQWAHAIAPHAKLVLIATNPAETEGVQGFPTMFIGEQLAVTRFPGSVMSQSFAATEQSFHDAAAVQVDKFQQIYEQAVTNRVTVFGSSGDSGTANVDKQLRVFPFPTVNWPSSDPLVTSAGGTWLQFGWKWSPTVTAETFFTCLASGTPSGTCFAAYLKFTTAPGRVEAVWKEDWLPAATGGGRSILFPTPSFQSGLSATLLEGSRGLPDVSWNAAVNGGVLVFTSFPGVRVGWHVVGGTSASSPQLAALVALANQLAHGQGKPSVGYLNPILYLLPSRDFRDIVPQTFGTGDGVVTLNSNKQFGSGIDGMATTAGWDLTTGFGSPKAYDFVHDLANAVP
jgi:subtilase family serine protease